jgi:dynein heavy chain
MEVTTSSISEFLLDFQENAIITKTARRWPLFIDPQGQANKWIRNLGKDKKIKVLKFSDNNYLKYLEACIR